MAGWTVSSRLGPTSRRLVGTTQAGGLRYNPVVAVPRCVQFRPAPGADEVAEDLPQDNAAAQSGVRGYSPVIWFGEHLQPGIHVIRPEEMVWRIRVRHDPAQTKRLARSVPDHSSLCILHSAFARGWLCWRIRVALGWLWGRIEVAFRCLPPGYQHALRWL